jgi:hypothetical protein
MQGMNRTSRRNIRTSDGRISLSVAEFRAVHARIAGFPAQRLRHSDTNRRGLVWRGNRIVSRITATTSQGQDSGFSGPCEVTHDIHVRPPLAVAVTVPLWMELLRLFLALDIAAAALLVGGREQILKLGGGEDRQNRLQNASKHQKWRSRQYGVSQELLAALSVRWWALKDSNLRPRACEARALTN